MGTYSNICIEAKPCCQGLANHLSCGIAPGVEYSPQTVGSFLGQGQSILVLVEIYSHLDKVIDSSGPLLN